MKFGHHMWERFKGVIALRHDPEGAHIISDMYWRALLLVSLSVVILALVYGVWGLLRVLDELGSSARVSVPPPPALNRAALGAAVDGINARRAQFEFLRSNSGRVIPDPS